MPNPNLEQLKELMKLVNQDHFSHAEGVKLFQALIKAIKDTKSQLKDEVAKDKKDMTHEVEMLCKALESKLEKGMKAVAQGEKDMDKMCHKMHMDMVSDFNVLKGEFKQLEKSIPKETDLSAVYEAINKKVIPSLEEILSGVEKSLPKYGEAYRDGLELLKGNDRLDKSAIRGLDNLEEDLKKAQVTFKGGGGNKAVFMYIDGVKKGLMNTFNLAAGEGVAIAHSKVNGLDTFTFTTASPTVTVTTPTGTVNAVNTVFTVTAEPKFVVADGTTYFANAGYTYAALQITMDIPPSSSIRAII